MLLIFTTRTDATADFLESKITRGGLPYLRFDTDRSVESARITYRELSPLLRIGETEFAPGDFSHVWYRRPERLKHPDMDDSPEGRFVYGEWAEALEGFLAHIPASQWMNHPTHNVGASHKIEQLSTARRLGFIVPETLVTQNPSEASSFFDRLNGEMIVKPMARGYLDRPDGVDSLVYTNRVCAEHLEWLNDLPSCPTLFQQYIAKQTDVRITVVDHDVHAVKLFAQDADGSQRCDIRRNNMDDVTYQAVELPVEVETGIRALMEHYRLRFAAIDMVVGTDGTWYFLEINPNGQWAWLDEAGCTNIAHSFIRSFGKLTP